MYLPNEILLSIFSSTCKKDLKSARSVSKLWCTVASTFLFDEIYVSSAKDDLEIFEEVAQSPLLNPCIRHLRYDATEFIHKLSKRNYIRLLREQETPFYERERMSRWETADSEANDWVNLVIIDRMLESTTIKKFKDSGLIRKGHREYTKQADYQHSILRNGNFLERLTASIAKLRSLDAVTLEGGWERSGLHLPAKGSYLARHWNRLYCAPEEWRWDRFEESDRRDGRLWRKAPDGILSYRLITCALARAQTGITSFSIGTDDCLPRLPPPVFDTCRHLTRDKAKYLGSDIAAFSNLELCTFRFASFGDDPEEGMSTMELFGNIGGLKTLLISMDHLKHLHLELPEDVGDAPTYYAAGQILPKGKVWHTLESLVLQNISISAVDLLHLVLYQTPIIGDLEIGGIDLLEGSWQAVFEALAVTKHVTDFRFTWDTYLFQHGGQDFWDWEERYPIYDEIEDYVINGGRHPCLEDRQPNEAASEYLDEFDPPLRERIIHFNESNSGIDIQGSRRPFFLTRFSHNIKGLYDVGLSSYRPETPQLSH